MNREEFTEDSMYNLHLIIQCTLNISPDLFKTLEIFNMLPEKIKTDVRLYGISDNQVVDDIYEFLMNYNECNICETKTKK